MFDDGIGAFVAFVVFGGVCVSPRIGAAVVVVDLLLLISAVCELIRASPSSRFELAEPGGSSGTVAVISVSKTYDPPCHRCLKIETQLVEISLIVQGA